MKRLLWRVLVVLLIAGCSGVQEAEPTASPTLLPTVPAATPTPLPAGATMAARIRARGTLRVGVRYDLYPFGSINAAGQPEGFGVDLGQELARRWFGDTAAVEFRQVRSDTAMEHIQSGYVDIVIGALTHSQEWEAGADFTLPVFIDGQALLVRGGDAAMINGPGALEGRLVGVVTWSGAEDALRAATSITLSVQNFDRFDTAVYAMGAGEVDAVADQRRRLFWGMTLQPGSGIVGQYSVEPVALAYPQNDAYFADMVNLTLQDMVLDSTYATIYQRWFSQELPPPVEIWPESSAETVTSAPQLAQAPLFASVPDTIGSIQQRGRVQVAVVPGRSPFAYFDASGTLVGYDVSLARLMTGHWLGDPSLVDFLPASAADGMEMLRTGQADMLIGAVPHTRGNELAMDFGTTTYIGGQGLMIWAGTPITTVRDLAGLQVAVVDGTGSREVLLAAAQSDGVSVSVLPQTSMESCIALMNDGIVSAVAGDRIDLLGPAYETPGLGVLPLRLTQVPLAIGLPPGDSAFRDLVNLTLQAMRADGQFDRLYGTWFDDGTPPQALWPGAPYRFLKLEGVAPPPVEGEGEQGETPPD